MFINMSQQRGYPGNQHGGYSDEYGQGGQGRRQKWNNPQQQGNYESSEGFYGEDQYSAHQPPARQAQQGHQYPGGGQYEDHYNDQYYYKGQDDRQTASYGQQGYKDDQRYYQGGRQYHQQDYYGDDYHQPHKQQTQKPYKKGGYPKQKRYPEEEIGMYGKKKHGYPQQAERSGSMQEGFSGSQHGYSQGTSQKGKAGYEPMQSGRKDSGKHESTSQPQSQHQIGGQGVTKPAFGEYYSQKRYQLEQESIRKEQLPIKGEQISQVKSEELSKPYSIGQVHLAADTPTTRVGPAQKGLISGSIHTKIEDDRFSKTMAKFNTLDRGTYFVREDQKCAHFMVVGRGDLLGWKDTFVINGYLLHGVIIKIMTLTSRIFLFVENLHSIYRKYIRIDEDGETARWTDEVPDSHQIATIKSIEKVEVLDNDEEGFEGFVCYTVCEDSALEFNQRQSDIADWKYVQELILLYEPTSIRKIYLDVVYNSIYKPESKGFGGKRIAAIVNPHVAGETVQFTRELVTALDKQCVIGTIWIQNGRYTLIAETIDCMERLIRLIDMALDIAEELNAYVMITNLRRTFDYTGKTILYINSDPTLKLIRSSNPIPFSNKIKKSEHLN